MANTVLLTRREVLNWANDLVRVNLLVSFANGRLSLPDLKKVWTDEEAAKFEILRQLSFRDEVVIGALTRANVDRLMSLPLAIGGSEDGLELIHETLAPRRVQTCNEYLEAVQAGYYGGTSYSIGMQASFDLVVAVVEAVKVANRAKASFVSNPRVGVANLELMPVATLPVFSSLEETLSPQEHGALTLQDLVRLGSVVVKSRTGLTLAIEHNGARKYFAEVMRADLDGDGIEDILVFAFTRAFPGTLQFGEVLRLTRRSKDVLLEAS